MLDNVIAQVLCHKENWPANQTVLLSAILRRSFSLKPACGVESVDLRISRAPRSLRASPRPGPATDRPIPQLRGKAPGVVHSPRHAACPSSLHTDASPPLLGRVPAVLLPLTPARNVGGLLAGVAGSPAAHSSRPQSAALAGHASSPPAISEAWHRASAFARGRALAPEWMPEPQTEGALVLARFPSLSHGQGEVRRNPTPPIDALSGHACCRRRLFHRHAFRKPSEDQSAAPVEVHGRILPQTRLEVHRARRCAWKATSWPKKAAFTLLSLLSPLFVLFGAFWRTLEG